MRDTNGMGAVIFALPQPSPVVTDTHYAPQLHTHEAGRCNMHSLTSGVFITDDLKSTTSPPTNKRYCITSSSILQRDKARSVETGHLWTHTIPGCFEFGKVVAHEVRDGHPWYTVVEVFKEVVDSEEEEKAAWEAQEKTTSLPRKWQPPGSSLSDIAAHVSKQKELVQGQKQSQEITPRTKGNVYVCLKPIKPVAVAPNKPEPLLLLANLTSPCGESFELRESKNHPSDCEKSLGGIYCFSISRPTKPALPPSVNVGLDPIGHNLEGCLVVRRGRSPDGSRMDKDDEILGIAICFDGTVKTTALVLPLGVILDVFLNLTGKKAAQGAEPAR